MNAQHASNSGREGQRGQVLPVFIIFLTAILLTASLLLDASMALLMRRDYQNAADAAALAAANVIQSGSPKGCSAVNTNPPGPPRAAVVSAAKASVAKNLPNYDLDSVMVSCPGGPMYNNISVQVSLHGDSPGFFSQVAGIESFAVDTRAVAINGFPPGARYSVMELDPYNPTWKNGERGCPSILFSGGITAVYEGSLYTNSACPASAGGAMAVNGGSATIQFNNGAGAYMVGGYNPGTLEIDPLPYVGARPLADPLAVLDPPTNASFGLQAAFCPPTYASRCNSQYKLGSGNRAILYPGIYPGGIDLGSGAVAVMTPGVYVMKGGGLNVQSGAALYSVKNGFDWNGGDPDAWTDENWDTQDCPADGSCGVLIYNYDWKNVKENINFQAGAVTKLRPYRPAAAAANTVHGNATNEETWRNVLIWQARDPAPTSTAPQPELSLQGGGNVSLTGTVYAPGALTSMGGSSGGSGGDNVDLTIQFISWDLYLHGSVNFHFYYRQDDLAQFPDYGLVE